MRELREEVRNALNVIEKVKRLVRIYTREHQAILGEALQVSHIEFAMQQWSTLVLLHEANGIRQVPLAILELSREELRAHLMAERDERQRKEEERVRLFQTPLSAQDGSDSMLLTTETELNHTEMIPNVEVTPQEAEREKGSQRMAMYLQGAKKRIRASRLFSSRRWRVRMERIVEWTRHQLRDFYSE